MSARHQPGPRHPEATSEMRCTLTIWPNYFYFHLVSILGNSLQTVFPQNILSYILGSARAWKMPGMAESDLVKGGLTSATAGGLKADFQGLVDTAAGWGPENQAGTFRLGTSMVHFEADSI
jgi:hypothetical protein